jgi:hypothetical protein
MAPLCRRALDEESDEERYDTRPTATVGIIRAGCGETGCIDEGEEGWS